jgi:hypothetical protein
MKLYRLYLLLNIPVFLLSAKQSQSQTFNMFGLKAGISLTGLSTYNEYGPTTYPNQHSYISDSASLFNYVSYDIGMFAEWFNTKHFCLSSEIHYLVKASSNTAEYTVPNYILAPEGNHWENGSLDDKIQYLSLMLLPRYRISITPSSEGNVYIFGGPVIEFILKDEGSYTQPNYIYKSNSLNNIGGMLGIGFEWSSRLSFEIRIEHDFIGPYNFKYRSEEIARRYTVITFLTGVSLFKTK